MTQWQKRLFFFLFSLISISTVTGCVADKAEMGVETAGEFKCADSIERMDGRPKAITFCRKKVEYCYEATGGAARSHGAHCRLLPSKNATCESLELAAGSSCSGETSTGIRVDFAFP